MADLGVGRAQNGGSRMASGPVPVPQAPAARVMTPTEVMRRRRDREARERAEIEARQMEEEDELKRIQEERRISAERRAATAGVVGSTGTLGVESGKRQSAGGRRSAGEQLTQDAAAGRRTERTSGGSATRVSLPAGSQPAAPAAAAVRAQETAGSSRLTADGGNVQLPGLRNRAASAAASQPRPVQPQTSRAASATYSAQQVPSQTRLTSAGGGTAQAQAGPSAAPSFQRSQAPQSSGPQPRNANTSSFPHAFERWETLSSHWEGLTSYWINRLDVNSDELKGQPLNQQLARQVTDLSAAGANLFHAVVELQRLRASSERKFQRWFYETQSGDERTKEKMAELENALLITRQALAEATAGGPRIDAERAAERLATERAEVQQIKRNTELQLEEMKRELKISRDEARRGWEEIGRMEQAERDRTASLRNGEPTLVGGVQVVPMLQGAVSRQASTNRPSTRDGPLPGDAGLMGLRAAHEESYESPGIGYTNYDPARSETDTDPFTEGGREMPSQTQTRVPTGSTNTTQQYQQSSNTSVSAAIQAARAAATSSHPISPQRSAVASPAAPVSGNTGTYLSYGPAGATFPTPSSGAFYQQQGTGTALLHEDMGPERPRTTEADERSYVPSNDDTFSEDEYELDNQGHVRHDSEGRPILVRQPSGSEDSEEFNQDALARERMYGTRYGSGVSGVEYGIGSTTTAGVVNTSNGNGNTTGRGPADYSGTGYGWEAMPRHQHPTRLSDVLEEDERSRTSPSRASERSRGLH
ncbi:hypothetical protein MMC19_001446 [Ptychographa xylographoides]|nr:hypothetical protein [Ptychographa xylographoides]